MGHVPPRASLAMTFDFFWNTSLLLGRTHQPSGHGGRSKAALAAGAGRRPGATAIKKKAKGATRNKKKKAADPEPTMASVNLLGAFFVKKAAAAAELAAAPSVR